MSNQQPTALRLHEELERKSESIQRLWKDRDFLLEMNKELLEALIEIATGDKNDWQTDRAKAAIRELSNANARTRKESTK